MNTVEVSVEGIPEPSWLSAFAGLCAGILDSRGKKNWEVSVLLCGDPEIQVLNRDFRNKDCPTDVLSFAQDEGGELPDNDENSVFLAGDIVISLDTVRFHAEKYAVLRSVELVRLFVHGLLHLEGHEHDTNSPEEQMILIQEEIMKSPVVNKQILKEIVF